MTLVIMGTSDQFRCFIIDVQNLMADREEGTHDPRQLSLLARGRDPRCIDSYDERLRVAHDGLANVMLVFPELLIESIC
jgi:hypothetical protein